MTRTVLVTGATGTVGQHVVTELQERDVDLRIATRDPGRVDTDTGAGEAVAFDFERPGTWVDALSGVDAVFLVRPPAVDTDRVLSFAEVASHADHVVYLSALGAERNPLIPHHRIEKRIAGTGADYTFLRASFFMQNLLEIHGPEIVEDGEILVPAGGGTTSFVDARDVAAVAAVALTEPGHENRAYDLTGPEALSYHEVAAIFREVLDREVVYREPSVFEFAKRMRGRGDPLPYVALMIGIYTIARIGLAGRVTDDVDALLGRPPRGMRTFVEDYAGEFHP